ncbi:MAG TPA: peroxiredoxin [Candidatus Micrarchaeota archaeon]|nr:peroxiredoxin [Candidatus Micrarchaeota archaeon]
MAVKVGEKVPEFTAQSYVNGEFRKVSLSDYKGKWVILFFYPRDFTFVCPTEIKGFAQAEGDFKKLNAEVIGASTDSEYSHQAWFERDLPMVKFPILADTNQRISRDYGVLVEGEGLALRGTFIIDPDGVLQYMVVANTSIGRSIQETVRTLEALQSGGLCPVDWKPGEKTLGKT